VVVVVVVAATPLVVVVVVVGALQLFRQVDKELYGPLEFS